MSLWRMLGFDPEREPAAGRGDAVRAIVNSLDRLDPERARHIAAFAYILGRVANVDLEVSREETRAMERIVREHGGIGDEEAVLVVQIAKSQHALFGSTESYVVTREFSRFATQEEKESLLECLFAVSASDHDVSGEEETEIRKIVGELDLSHADFIAVRARFKEHIAALRDLPPGKPSPG
ncbi:MAG TPA: TerB family tellurite resistance protein [Candidatus Eisenbacteria bacterium]|nr:TerB family tellurite resistance protein [Candidatus Eisenbacteria bacterium]